MFQDRRDSWIKKALVLSVALSMFGAGGLLQLTEHLPGGEDGEAPWECAQCKIAKNPASDLGELVICFEISIPSEFLASRDEAEAPIGENLTPAAPRAPPVFA